MTTSRDALLYVGGALLVVLGVVLWLWWTAPPADTLPTTYRYGVL